MPFTFDVTKLRLATLGLVAQNTPTPMATSAAQRIVLACGADSYNIERLVKTGRIGGKDAAFVLEQVPVVLQALIDQQNAILAKKQQTTRGQIERKIARTCELNLDSQEAWEKVRSASQYCHTILANLDLHTRLGNAEQMQFWQEAYENSQKTIQAHTSAAYKAHAAIKTLVDERKKLECLHDEQIALLSAAKSEVKRLCDRLIEVISEPNISKAQASTLDFKGWLTLLAQKRSAILPWIDGAQCWRLSRACGLLEKNTEKCRLPAYEQVPRTLWPN